MRHTPTPLQREVLELLTEVDALTTSQIGDYLSGERDARLVRRLLATLQARGWVRAAPLYPDKGTASVHYWTLTPCGAQVLPGPVIPRRVPPLPTLQQRLAPAAAPPPATPRQMAVLTLLAEWKQLTTSQIWHTLYAERPRRYLTNLLIEMAARGFIAGTALDPTAGRRAEYYWRLRRRGAAVIGLAYGKHYRQRPTTSMLQYRGLRIDILRQLEKLGWQIIRSRIYSRSNPKPDETPQYQPLVAAVLAVEGQKIAAELAAGVARRYLQERITEQQAGRVGAIVPRDANDYVITWPGHPERTAVLIPHPPGATLSFWTHKSSRRRGSRQVLKSRRESRIARYRRLATFIPVLAIFADAVSAGPYTEVLERAGFGWTTIDALRERLAALPHAGLPPR